MQRILVLVDFDNCRNDRLNSAFGTGNINFKDYESVFEEVISGIVNDALPGSADRPEVTFRFYGGWYDAQTGSTTDLHEMLVQCINNYPRRTYKRARLILEIAYAPIFRGDFRFDATLRTEPWKRPEGKTSSDAECHMSPGSACAEIIALGCWIRGRCPKAGCGRKLRDVATRRGQKLVDTMIVADCVAASSSDLFDHVVILSADDDLVPGLLPGNSPRCSLSLARLNYSGRGGRYDRILAASGVEIHDI